MEEMERLHLHICFHRQWLDVCNLQRYGTVGFSDDTSGESLIVLSPESCETIARMLSLVHTDTCGYGAVATIAANMLNFNFARKSLCPDHGVAMS